MTPIVEEILLHGPGVLEAVEHGVDQAAARGAAGQEREGEEGPCHAADLAGSGGWNRRTCALHHVLRASVLVAAIVHEIA
ncbi:hypothetical protein [Bradyrhizobium altum]|uniref:hypothetical protein n=1 Tax=Bradyrhizobium altum TaxID=1571202 RepID=UPI001E351ACF|nr:hypothetical protein [Bradyrhizobium altum]